MVTARWARWAWWTRWVGIGGAVALAAAVNGCHKDPDEQTTPDPTTPGLVTRPANPTCLAPERPPSTAAVQLVKRTDVVIGRGTFAAQPPDDPTVWWFADQGGTVYRFDATVAATTPETVLDLRDKVDDGANEAGLLGLAFDPNWATNREVIVSYTATGSPFRSTISRFRSTDGGATLDPSTEQVILTIDQPFTNHNGGNVVFGHDGYLYAGFGDGGSAGDPFGNGQNTNTLLGKMLRIDVHGGSPYGIPPDNPFAAGGGRPEIYAWGLRNPWRFSVDPGNGDLWVGDVGQDEIEEIDIVRRGGNYGWNRMEGDQCYGVVDCDTSGLVLPIATTLHSDGDASVTGGVVYRGAGIPGLQGTYVFADYGSGRVYGLTTDLSGRTEVETLLDTAYSITHIGTDAAGEIVMIDRNSGLWTLEPSGPQAPNTFPNTLSATGCFDPANPGDPLPMLIPYAVAQPFWSDGADKARWLAIPDGTAIAVDDRGELVLPIGSIAVKDLVVGGRKVETRLLVRHTDGAWAGYTYQWNDTDTDATLLRTSSEALGGGGVPWSIPSPQQCLECHTFATGGSLGLSLAQLDVPSIAAGATGENQVDLLARLGMLDLPDGAVRPGPHPALDDDTASLEARARAYLDVNCSFCHFDGGTGGGDLDLRFDVALADTALCGDPHEGDLGIPGAKVITPGDPSRSVLAQRIRRRDASGMPPLASVVVDEAGADVIDAWISGMASCP